MGRHTAFALSALAALSLLGCRGTIAEEDGPLRPTSTLAWQCSDTSVVSPGQAPVRRLTNDEYANTVRDLFGGGTLPELPEQPPDALREGTFANDASALGPSDVRVSRWETSAMRLGELAANDADTRALVVPCDTEDAACGREFIEFFGTRAMRRPLSAEEIDRYAAFFERQRAEIDFDAAVQLTVAAMLQSPSFLYRLEIGNAGEGQIPLTSYEVASRLSYFLWESMPDEELFTAAAADELRSPEQLELQARRLLEDERAHATIRNFHRQWLHLDRVGEENKVPEYEAWGPGVPEAAVEASERFVEELFFDGGTLSDLLTSNVAWVNDDLAPIYGVEPTGDWQRVELPQAERGGILSRVAFLAGQAHAANGSPPLRGVFVMERFLCEPRPSPPADADTSPPEADPEVGPMTNRMLFEERTAPSGCQSCHVRIDGFGMGFEHYDAIGAYREIDNTLPVDASGYVTGTDNNGPYTGAVELQERLAGADSVHRCVTTQWFQYAYGRAAEPQDSCHVERLQRRFIDSGGDLSDLLVGIVVSPEFQMRSATATEE